MLDYLCRTERQAARMGELSEQTTAWENDVAVSAVTSAERKRVFTSLQQRRLPRMDEMDVVDFDDRSGDGNQTEMQLQANERTPERVR